MELVRLSGLEDLLPQGAKVFGDPGFKGLPCVLTAFGTDELYHEGQRVEGRVQHNKAVHRRRWKTEAVFSRMKNFAILEKRFGRSLSLHRSIFLAAVAAYNIDIVLHPLTAAGGASL